MGFISQYWRLFAIIGLIVGGYVKGCSDEKGRFDQFKAQVEATGEAQRKMNLARIANDKKAQKEVEDARKNSAPARVERVARIGSGLRANAGRGITAPAAPGPAGPVQTACYDLGKLDAGIRASFDRLLDRLTPILQSGAEGLDDAGWWRTWALKVGSCKP